MLPNNETVSSVAKKKSVDALLRDMKQRLLDDRAPVSSILRMALVLSYEINDLKLREWANSELDGYGDDDEVPDYRHGRCQSFGDLVGPGYAYMNAMPLPPSCIPEKYHVVTNNLLFRENFRTLEETLIKALKDGGAAKCNWPADLIARLADKFYQHFRLVSAWVLVQPSDILEIVETVRNRMLRYVLEIDSSYNSVEGNIHLNKSDRVETVFNTTILGDVNGLNQRCENVDQSIVDSLKMIAPGDWASLMRFLDRIGNIEQKDKEDLKAALDEDKKAGFDGIGANVQKWIDRVQTGSVKLATSISTNVIANLITQAIVVFLTNR